jgi:hypothetical protein
MDQPSKIWKIYFSRSIELEQILGKGLFILHNPENQTSIFIDYLWTISL